NHTFPRYFPHCALQSVRLVVHLNCHHARSYSGPAAGRMEIIELQGYTEDEKTHIAFRYLIPRQIEANGITAERIEFPEETVRYIIRHYTREAGVRNLEREIGTLCRKQARRIAEG